MAHGMMTKTDWDAKVAKEKTDREDAKNNPDKGKTTLAALSSRVVALEKLLNV